MSAYGNTNARRALTEEQVRAIRRDHARKQRQIAELHATYSIESLARRYGVHARTVEKVLSYETWRNVED